MLYQRIDAYACMFYNRKVSWFFETLFGENYRTFEIFKSMFDFENTWKGSAVSLGDSFNFMSHGLHLQVQNDVMASLSDPRDIFTTELPRFRVELKGEALNYCRELGVDIDTLFFDPTLWEVPQYDQFGRIVSGCYKVTRMDLAFDFINEQGDFLDRFRNWRFNAISLGMNPQTKLNCVSKGGGMNYIYIDDSTQHTLKLGGRNSKKLLRVYDKKLEQSQKGIFDEELSLPASILDEVGHVESWIRFEVELHDSYLASIMFSPLGVSVGWSYIQENFLVKDPLSGKLLPMFRDLYDWSKTQHFSPVFYFIQSKDTLHGCRVQVSRSTGSMTTLAEVEGIRAVFRLWLAYLADVKCNPDCDARKLLGYRCKLSNALAEAGMTYEDSKWREIVLVGNYLGLIDSEFPILKKFL